MTLYSKVLGEWNLFPTDQMTADLEMATKQAEGCEPGSPEDSFLTAIRSMIEASLPKLTISSENMTMVVGPDQRSLSTSVLHQNADTVVLAVVMKSAPVVKPCFKWMEMFWSLRESMMNLCGSIDLRTEK